MTTKIATKERKAKFSGNFQNRQIDQKHPEHRSRDKYPFTDKIGDNKVLSP